MLRCVTAILLLGSSVCAAVTPAEIVADQVTHHQGVYVDAKCSFKYFAIEPAGERLHVEGTLSIFGNNRRIDYKEQTANGNTGDLYWQAYRYALTDGKLYSNVIGNNLVHEVSDREKRSQLMLFAIWSPWNPLALVAGDGQNTLQSILTDPLNKATIARETSEEVILDLSREGMGRYATFRLDPTNHFAVTRMELVQGSKIFQERSIGYSDGVMTSLSNKMGQLNYRVEMNWESGVQPEELTPGSIASDGDVVIMPDANGEERAFDKRDNSVVLNKGFNLDFKPTARPASGPGATRPAVARTTVPQPNNMNDLRPTSELPTSTSLASPGAGRSSTVLNVVGIAVFAVLGAWFFYLMRKDRP